MHTESPELPAVPRGPWLALIVSYRLVEQGGDILFLVPMGCTEHHHTILRGRNDESQGRGPQRT